MELSVTTRRLITFWILGISLLVWIVLLFNPGHIMTVEHCHVSDAGPSKASLQMLLSMNPISSLLLGWGLMVVAMMLPKLLTPIAHIYKRSLKRRRFWSALLFVLGYILVWMVVGVFMNAMTLGAHLLLPNSFIPALLLGIIAILWQFSPIKQRFLNRGHDHWPLSAFGWAASRDAFLFGLMHGVWCVGAGWAIMLFPMLLPAGHNLAMVIVTIVMISEHLEHPQRPRWKINLRLKLIKLAFVRAKIRLVQPLLPTDPNP